MDMNDKRLDCAFNQKAAAYYLGMYVQKFRRLMKKAKNKLVYYKIGGRYYFKKEDLDTWLESFKNK